MEGEEAGPNYGAVNGVPPALGSRRSGSSTTLPLGRAASRQDPHDPLVEQLEAGPTTSDRPSVFSGVQSGTRQRARSAGQQPTGSAVDLTGSGANVRREEPQQQANPSTSVPTIPSTVAQPMEQRTQQQPAAAAPAARDRLPPPLQHAVQQLSQQRTAVIQAVQTRAQRALHGPRVEEGVSARAEGSVFASAESLAGSPQAVQHPEEDRGAGSWSVARISQILHRRLVAPMLEHVGGGDRLPPSPVWQSPSSATVQEPLMSPETRQAMASWTARPTALTTPPALTTQQRDDSSDKSMSQEVIMEEVRRQVQMAMQGRDSELQALKSQNSELKKALDTSAQLLNDVMQQGGSMPRRDFQEARQGPPGTEPGGVPAGEDLGYQAHARGPPGLEGLPRLPGGNPRAQGRREPSVERTAYGAPGQTTSAGSNLGTYGAGTCNPPLPGLSSQGLLHGAGEVGEDAEMSPLDVLVQGMKQLQQVYMDKKISRHGGLERERRAPTAPGLVGGHRCGIQRLDVRGRADHRFVV